jgi:DNA-binding transcriptional regulator YbjK
MKNVNIGIANLIISNKLKDSYFNNNLVEESKAFTSDFFSVVRNSPILQLEFKVFDDIENKHIENELLATRYIDNNIKLFEVYTIKEIDAERAKLNKFISEEIVPIGALTTSRVDLYNAIDELITESLSSYDVINVDKIHESFVTVLNHIREPKKALLESIDIEEVNEDIIELAVGKYNEKYSSLNEDDKALLQKLIKSNDHEKEKLLETYKQEGLTLLENVKDDSVKDNISKSINKIKGMKYSKEKVVDDIISLHELKKDLM